MATVQNPIFLTIYLAGENEDHALSCMPFDDIDNADQYAIDNGYNLYSVEAIIDPSTIEPIGDTNESTI